MQTRNWAITGYPGIGFTSRNNSDTEEEEEREEEEEYEEQK